MLFFSAATRGTAKLLKVASDAERLVPASTNEALSPIYRQNTGGAIEVTQSQPLDLSKRSHPRGETVGGLSQRRDASANPKTSCWRSRRSIFHRPQGPSTEQDTSHILVYQKPRKLPSMASCVKSDSSSMVWTITLGQETPLSNPKIRLQQTNQVSPRHTWLMLVISDVPPPS